MGLLHFNFLRGTSHQTSPIVLRRQRGFLLKELLDGNPQKKPPPKREDVSAILYDIGPENLVCDFFDVLTPEELDVLVRQVICSRITVTCVFPTKI